MGKSIAHTHAHTHAHLTLFKLASTNPTCPPQNEGMVVKEYLTTGNREWQAVIIFLMRGRSPH